jgi:TonB family protein
VFEELIESKHKPDKGRSLGMGFVSLTIHTALIAAAIIATVQASQSDTKIRTGSVLVIVGHDPCPGCGGPPPGLPPPSGPLGIPRIPWEDSGSGVDSGLANSMVPEGTVYWESLVEEKPSVRFAPPPPYPALLKQAGIQGRVLIQAIIDTSGRAERNSVRIIQSPNPAFDPGSRTWILHVLFRPARVHGRAVRVLIQVPLDYRITSR